VEFELHAARRRLRPQGDHTDLIAVGVGDFPISKHGLDRVGRRRLRQSSAEQKRRGEKRDGERTKHSPMIAQVRGQLYFFGGQGVSATGVSGGLPAPQARRLSTTS